MGDVPVPQFTRLEYLTPTGWMRGHNGISLLHPERYVERLGANGKYGRATVLDNDLQTVLAVYVTPGADTVDRSSLVPSSTRIPRKAETCPICNEAHAAPFDGSCLL
jgi:hypothetical protein